MARAPNLGAGGAAVGVPAALQLADHHTGGGLGVGDGLRHRPIPAPAAKKSDQHPGGSIRVGLFRAGGRRQGSSCGDGGSRLCRWHTVPPAVPRRRRGDRLKDWLLWRCLPSGGLGWQKPTYRSNAVRIGPGSLHEATVWPDRSVCRAIHRRELRCAARAAGAAINAFLGEVQQR